MNKFSRVLKSTCTTVASVMAILGVLAFGVAVSVSAYHTIIWSVQGYIYPYTTHPYWSVMPGELSLFDVSRTPWPLTAILVVLLVCTAAQAICGLMVFMQGVFGDRGVRRRSFSHEEYRKSIRDARRVRLEERLQRQQQPGATGPR